MEELNRIANGYFSAFEGRSHYPPLLSWYWVIWAVILVFWLASMAHAFVAIRAREEHYPFLVFSLEILFFASSLIIENYKRRSLISTNGLGARTSREEFDEAKSRYLSRALRKKPSQFVAVARDAQELLAMHVKLRSGRGTAPAELWTSVYDSEQNARLTGIFVGALAILVSLLVVGLPPDAPNILEVIASNDFLAYMNFWLGISVVLFGLGWMIRLIWFEFMDMSSFWGARLSPRSGFPRMKVNYLLRDLVRLHVISGLEEEGTLGLPYRQRERRRMSLADRRSFIRGRKGR